MKSGAESSSLQAMSAEQIGKRMALLRAAFELKPAEISDMLGIERTYWSRFEGGKRRVSDEVALMLVERFGISLDWLILGRWDRLPLDVSNRLRAALDKI